MLQEVIALLIVAGASALTLYKIIRFFMPVKNPVKGHGPGGCSKCKQ